MKHTYSFLAIVATAAACLAVVAFRNSSATVLIAGEFRLVNGKGETVLTMKARDDGGAVIEIGTFSETAHGDTHYVGGKLVSWPAIVLNGGRSPSISLNIPGEMTLATLGAAEEAKGANPGGHLWLSNDQGNEAIHLGYSDRLGQLMLYSGRHPSVEISSRFREMRIHNDEQTIVAKLGMGTGKPALQFFDVRGKETLRVPPAGKPKE